MSLIEEHISLLDRPFGESDLKNIAENLLSHLRSSIDKYEAEKEINDFIPFVIKYRDRGFPKIARDLMFKIWNARKSRNICLEILVLDVMILKDASSFLEFAATISKEFLEDKHISLLLAGGYMLSDDLSGFLQNISKVSRQDVSHIQSFNDLANSLIRVFFEKIHKIINDVSILNSFGQLKNVEELIKDRSFLSSILDCKNSAEFEEKLIYFFFISSEDRRLSFDRSSALIVELFTRFPTDERNAVLFRFLVAIGERVEADEFAKVLFNSDLRHNPDYVKTLFKLSELPGMGVWRQLAIAFARGVAPTSSRGGAWQNPRALLQARELSARVLKIEDAPEQAFSDANVLPKSSRLVHAEKGTPNHLFIGLFGQCRFPNYVLPLLSLHLREQTQPLLDQGWSISYGASTWEVSGYRGLHDSDSIQFLYERLPQEIKSELSKLPISTVAEAKILLPETVKLCSELGAGVDKLTNEYFRKALATDVYTNIGIDEVFMAEIGQKVRDHFGGDPNIINQARMWNRLAGLAPQILQAGRDTGKLVSHCLLSRIDLNFLDDQLWKNIISKGITYPANFVFADHDPHANFIEGLGDRLMFCDVAAFNRILSGEHLLRYVMDHDKTHSLYKACCSAHMFLDTILFENDTRVIRVPWSEIKHEIYRGRLALSEVQYPLRKDLESNHPALEGMRLLIYPRNKGIA